MCWTKFASVCIYSLSAHHARQRVCHTYIHSMKRLRVGSLFCSFFDNRFSVTKRKQLIMARGWGFLFRDCFLLAREARASVCFFNRFFRWITKGIVQTTGSLGASIVLLSFRGKREELWVRTWPGRRRDFAIIVVLLVLLLLPATTLSRTNNCGRTLGGLWLEAFLPWMGPSRY